MAGVVNFETICTDIERAPKSACGKIDRESLHDIWASVSRTIAGGLRSGRATKVLNFGTFGIGKETLEFVDGSVREATVPSFRVTESLAKSANVLGGKSAARRGAVSGSRTSQLNPMQVAQETGLSRDIVTSALRELFVFLADRIRLGQNVQVQFPGLGKLLSRADKLHFRFTPSLVESISGGQPVNARLAHRMLTTNQRGRYLATEGGANYSSTSQHQQQYEYASGTTTNNHNNNVTSFATSTRSIGGGGGGGTRRLTQRRSSSRHSERHASSGAYANANATGGLSLTGGRPASSSSAAYNNATARSAGAVASRRLSSAHSRSGSRNATGGGGGFGAGSNDTHAVCGHDVAHGAQPHASGLCRMCREREAVLQAKREAAQREREADRRRAEEDALRAAEADARDKEKEAAKAASRREDARFNIEQLHRSQRENKHRLRAVEMGSLFESRKEAATDPNARERIRAELDEQVRIKQNRDAELRRRDLESDRLQQEAAEASLLSEERRRAMAREEHRRRAREDLEYQMRAKAEAVPKAYDATDTGFTASEGPEQVEARRRRALELQAEQRALIAARAEARRFEKRAEADYSIKESLKTRAALDREVSMQHSKKEAMKGDLRAAWDEQIAARARARDLERYGQEKSLTSLALPDMEEDDGDNCVRCGGPMPDGIRIKVPNRVHAGLKA